MLEWQRLKPILGGTWVLVDLVAMSPVLAKHCHFGCTSVVGSSSSVDLLGGGGVPYWLRINGCPMWIDVHHMRVWLSPLACLFFRTFVDLFFGERRLSSCGKGWHPMLCHG